MSRTVQLQASGSVVLNGSGAGQVQLGPAIPGVSWTPTGANCFIPGTPVNVPVFYVYLNSVGAASYLGGSQTGNNDVATISGLTAYTGMTLIGVWTGGDPGVTATMNLSGTMTLPG